MTRLEPERRIRVLLVTASDAEAMIIVGMLRSAQASSYMIERAHSTDDATDRLSTERFHAVLVDAALEPGDPGRLLGRMHRTAHGPPILVVAGCVDEVWARRALQGGADDVLERGTYDSARLIRAIDASVTRRRRAVQLGEQARRLDARLADASDYRHALEKALTLAADGMALTRRDAPGHIDWCNAAFEQLADTSAESSVPWFEVLDPADARTELIDAIRVGTQWSRRMRARTRDLDLHVSPSGPTGLTLISIRDVTREERVLRADRARQAILDQLLDGASIDEVVTTSVVGLDQLLEGACCLVPTAPGAPIRGGLRTEPLDDDIRRLGAPGHVPPRELVERPLDVSHGRALRALGYSRVWLWDTVDHGVLVALRPTDPSWDSLDRPLFTQSASLLSILPGTSSRAVQNR